MQMSSSLRLKTAVCILVVIAVLGFITTRETTTISNVNDDDFSQFTIELNCVLPSPPEEINIISVGKGTYSQEELVKLATEIFQMDNVNVTFEEEDIILTSGEKTLHYYPTDYIKYRDRSIDRDKVVPVKETALLTLAEDFLDSLWVYFPLPEGDKIHFERTEYPDYHRTFTGKTVSSHPQYVVYYHNVNGTPVLALNAEFNLGFADGKIAYADISRLNTVGFESTKIVKTPIQAILEAFPGAEFRGGSGVASFTRVPVRGKIIVENFRVMHYNWHGPSSKPVGETYDLFPYYKFDVLIIGPDKEGKNQSIRMNREIKAN